MSLTRPPKHIVVSAEAYDLKIESRLTDQILKMKQSFAGVGGVAQDYLQQISSKAVDENIEAMSRRQESQIAQNLSFRQLSPLTKKTSLLNKISNSRQKSQNVIKAQDIEESVRSRKMSTPLQITDDFNQPINEENTETTFKTSLSSSELSEGKENNESIDSRIQYQRIEKLTRNRGSIFNLKSDRFLSRQKAKKQLKESVASEINNVEQMFPIKLVSQRSRKILDRIQTIQNMKRIGQGVKIQPDHRFKTFLVPQSQVTMIEESQEKSMLDSPSSRSYFNVPKHNKSNQIQAGVYHRQNVLSKGKLAQIPARSSMLHMFSGDQNSSIIEEDSFISDLTENPYKNLPEKQLMFKILDKHQDVLTDKKKRQDQLQRVAFLKGLFNNQSLQWELKNNQIGSSNQASLTILKHTAHDSSSIRDLKSIKQSINQRENRKRIIQASKSVASLFQSNQTPERSRLKRDASQEYFESVKLAHNEIVSECKSARKAIRDEKKRFFADEDQLKRLINVQKRFEQRIDLQKQKLQDAENFAKLVSNDNVALRRKLFNDAFQEFKDEEYHEIKTKELEGFLNQEFKKGKAFQEKYIINFKHM